MRGVRGLSRWFSEEWDADTIRGGWASMDVFFPIHTFHLSRSNSPRLKIIYCKLLNVMGTIVTDG